MPGADLHGAHLAGTNLSGADLEGGNLRDADLRNADLHGARVCWKNDDSWNGGDRLGCIDLTGADLPWGQAERRANLSERRRPARQRLLAGRRGHPAGAVAFVLRWRDRPLKYRGPGRNKQAPADVGW